MVSIIKNSSFTKIEGAVVNKLDVAVAIDEVEKGVACRSLKLLNSLLAFISGNVSRQKRTIEVTMINTDIIAMMRAYIDECGYSNRSHMRRLYLFLGNSFTFISPSIMYPSSFLYLLITCSPI
jgi:hypothetical protein